MKYPTGSLTNKQIIDLAFIPPEVPELYQFVLGTDRYEWFLRKRTELRDSGGEILVIALPDGTTITFERPDASRPLDFTNVISTYRANAALHRAFK